MATRVDHFMYAVPSLEDGMSWASETFGIEAAHGGEHVGLGTRNALMSLGRAYLEIIAPDPAQPHKGNFGETLSALSEGGLVTWCAEGALSNVAANLKEQGVKTVGPNRTKRSTSDGKLLEWELLFPTGSPFLGCMPFFIDWLDCDNPKDTTPLAGEFQSLSISTPEAPGLSNILDNLGLDIPVKDGERSLAIIVSTKKGEVVLSSTPETAQIRIR